MEWLALVLWAVIAALALPIGSGALAAPPLGVAPLLGVAGLVLSVLFAIDGAAALAWIAAGVAFAGAVTIGLGAAQLMAGEVPGGPQIGRAEEHASFFAGIAWPLFAAAIGVSVLAALAADGTL